MQEAAAQARGRARREAYRLLSRRARTCGEIRAALARRHEPGVVESVLRSLQSEGALDDGRTGREWLAWRRDHDPLGRARLEAELCRRGLDRELVGTLLQEYYEAHREQEDLERALQRMLGDRPLPEDAAALRRLAARLARRGFPGGATRRALRGRMGPGAEEEAWESDD